MKYYFYFVDNETKRKNPDSATRISTAYQNRSEWVELTEEQTKAVSVFLTSGHNFGRDNVTYDNKNYVIFISQLDITDANNPFVLYICTAHPDPENN